MIDEIKRLLSEYEIIRITESAVQLGVIENNLLGIRFWVKHGFKRIRESRNSSDSANPLNIVIMEKRIL